MALSERARCDARRVFFFFFVLICFFFFFVSSLFIYLFFLLTRFLGFPSGTSWASRTMFVSGFFFLLFVFRMEALAYFVSQPHHFSPLQAERCSLFRMWEVASTWLARMQRQRERGVFKERIWVVPFYSRCCFFFWGGGGRGHKRETHSPSCLNDEPEPWDGCP